MKTVQILLSSYNGEKVIKRQIYSILGQEEVDIHILVRDDGSNDKTVSVVEEIQKQYPAHIEILKGRNIGWKGSFHDLLFLSGDYDYYGFSDQDDYWDSKKIISCIETMNDSYIGAKLCQCGSLCVNDNLVKLKEQEKNYSSPKNKKMAVAQEYFRGCSMIWNSEAMKLIKEFKPSSNIAHDYWVGLLCYYFGKVYFCPDKLLYHIRYGNNSSSDGNQLIGRVLRLRSFINGGHVYFNPCNDLLKGYGNRLTNDDKCFLNSIVNYKNSFSKKMKVVLDTNFRREGIFSTILFKLTIILERY